MPPQAADDIELNQLKHAHYGLNASVDMTDFMATHKTEMENLFPGFICCFKNLTG